MRGSSLAVTKSFFFECSETKKIENEGLKDCDISTGNEWNI